MKPLGVACAIVAWSGPAGPALLPCPVPRGGGLRLRGRQDPKVDRGFEELSQGRRNERTEDGTGATRPQELGGDDSRNFHPGILVLASQARGQEAKGAAGESFPLLGGMARAGGPRLPPPTFPSC